MFLYLPLINCFLFQKFLHARASIKCKRLTKCGDISLESDQAISCSQVSFANRLQNHVVRKFRALQEFCNRWCKGEHVESNALNSWELNIFKINDGRISFYCSNLELLTPKPKFTFRHLKKGIQEFHRRFVLAPADKAAKNVAVI